MARAFDIRNQPHRPSTLVTVREAFGSTPREAGARMLVDEASVTGTIGGGRLEFDAIATARAMLHSSETMREMSVPLGPEIGQCCGGRVALCLERMTEAVAARIAAERDHEASQRPAVLIFGAGHTGQALVTALAPLPLALTVVDSRPDALKKLSEAVAVRAVALPERLVETAPSGAAYLVVTHDHGLDFMIAAAALARKDAAYVGMIGSATKRARFASYLRDEGQGGAIDRLTLPIGGSALRDKRPEVIAALVAAELAICLFSRQQENAAHSLGSGAGAMQ